MKIKNGLPKGFKGNENAPAEGKAKVLDRFSGDVP